MDDVTYQWSLERKLLDESVHHHHRHEVPPNPFKSSYGKEAEELDRLLVRHNLYSRTDRASPGIGPPGQQGHAHDDTNCEVCRQLAQSRLSLMQSRVNWKLPYHPAADCDICKKATGISPTRHVRLPITSSLDDDEYFFEKLKERRQRLLGITSHSHHCEECERRKALTGHHHHDDHSHCRICERRALDDDEYYFQKIRERRERFLRDMRDEDFQKRYVNENTHLHEHFDPYGWQMPPTSRLSRQAPQFQNYKGSPTKFSPSPKPTPAPTLNPPSLQVTKVKRAPRATPRRK